MQAYWEVASSDAPAFEKNLQAVKDQLTKVHGLALSKDDLDGIDYVYRSFYAYGPAINYSSSANAGAGRGNMTNYAELMMATDAGGKAWSYLADEEAFRWMKDFEAKNLIVPVVGNFGGRRALSAVGQYVRDHAAMVGAFYLSNVEQYLRQDGIFGVFCANVASMPLDDRSTFIRSFSNGGGGISRTRSATCRPKCAGAPGVRPRPSARMTAIRSTAPFTGGVIVLRSRVLPLSPRHGRCGPVAAGMPRQRCPRCPCV